MTDAISRDTRPLRGPHFYREGHRDMIVITIDSRSSVGPMPVTEEHRIKFPGAWAAYCEAQLREMI